MEQFQKLIKLYFNHDSVTCTLEHPFFVNNTWVAAKDLKVGNYLFSLTNSEIRIDSLYQFKTDSATNVFNLEVAGNNDYYVSTSRVLVHNCNLESEAILKDGFYEVNGFKFSEYYYNKLWETGRMAPTFRAQAILDLGNEIGHSWKEGFIRYIYDGWEMIYNPSTKEVWHLAPLK